MGRELDVDEELAGLGIRGLGAKTKGVVDAAGAGPLLPSLSAVAASVRLPGAASVPDSIISQDASSERDGRDGLRRRRVTEEEEEEEDEDDELEDDNEDAPDNTAAFLACSSS